MTEDWDDYAENWDRDAQPRQFSEQAFASLKTHVSMGVEVHENARILDFGCGTGLLTEKLAPLAKEVIAVDTSPKMLDVLRTKPFPMSRSFAPTWMTRLCAGEPRGSPSWILLSPRRCAVSPDYEDTVRNLCRRYALAGTSCSGIGSLPRLTKNTDCRRIGSLMR